jgi:hypothetical protein
MIDSQTGALHLTPTAHVRVGDSVETVAALALGESNEVRDMHTGWQWLYARNVQVGPDYFTLDFGFYNNSLKTISLSFSHEQSEKTASWDDWSEQAEMQRLAEFKQWLRKELGHEGSFSWGTATADYDRKKASSSITIRYT